MASPTSKYFNKAVKISTPEELASGVLSTDVGGAWGAAYAVGTPISALITGICCALALEYFQKFPKDVPRIRGSVIVVVATTIVGAFIAIELTYVRLVKNETPPGGFIDIPWQDDAVALVCGICQLICSAYFAYSAYSVATRKKIVAVWFLSLMVLILLSAFFRAICGVVPADWFDGAVLGPKMTFMWLICSLLLDFSISVTLLAHLRAPPKPTTTLNKSFTPPPGFPNLINNPETSYKPRAPVLNRLLTTILTSFSLTAALMFSLFILILAMHGTEFDPNFPKTTGIFTALRLLTTPTYAVTFLYTLNRRKPYSLTSTEARLARVETGGGGENVDPLSRIGASAFGITNDEKTNKPSWPTFFPIIPPKKKRGSTKERKESLKSKLGPTEVSLPLSVTSLRFQTAESAKLFKQKFRSPPQPFLKLPPKTVKCDVHRQPIYSTTRQSSIKKEIDEDCRAETDRPLSISSNSLEVQLSPTSDTGEANE